MKITKKNSEKFFNSIKDFIINELKGEGGQTRFDHNRYEYTIETIVGKLFISLYSNQSENTLYSVCSFFNEVERAKEKFNCNPNSGKYNIHTYGDIDEVISEVINHFEITQEKVA